MLNYLPKIKFLLILNLLVCSGNLSYTQNFAEDILKKIRNHQFSEVDAILKVESKTDLIVELAFYNKLIANYGIEKDSIKIMFHEKAYEEPLLIAIQKLNKGLHGMLYDYDNLDIAFLELHKAFEIAEKLDNKPLICEILKALFFNYYDKGFTSIPKHGYKKYIDKYAQYVYDSVEREIYDFIRIHIKMVYLSDNYYLQDDELKKLYILREHISNDYFKGRALLSLGIYYENHLQDFEYSLACYEKAKKIFSKQSYGIYFERWLSMVLNEARILQKKKSYPEMFLKIKIFQNESLHYSGKQIDWLKMYEYLYLKESYADFNDVKQYEKYNFKYKELKNKFDQAKQDILIEGKRIELNVEKIKKENMNLTTILSIVLPISALIIIALFYYFKKYKSKSKNLESAQSETLEKIEELKKIVIKNHIVLKDKTKVYISDLMYIKSEDHYLRIFTNDTKSAFVRGKLSQIKEELPPNFIQSHRSYIINSNFIKQINNNHIILLDKTEIPLSRSHKNNFKDKP